MQNDLSIANADGATVRADINSALQALATMQSGSTAPDTTYAGQLWWDTGNNLIKRRNGANTAWITIASFDGTTHIPYRDGSALGTAAGKDHGTGSAQVPLNNDLGTASLVDTGTASGEVPTVADLAGLIDQSMLKTTSGEVSTSSNRSTSSLPGGDYGFAPTVRDNAAGNHIATFVSHENSDGVLTGTNFGTTSDVCNFMLGQNAGGTIWAEQRYIQASPPYDLGDGEVALFVWVLMEAGGNRILGTQIAREAPWHNNGPTKIRPDFVEGRKKYKRARRLGDELILSKTDRQRALAALRKDRSMADAVAALKDAPVEVVEIDQSIKQRDMPLLPHPWVHDPSVADGTAIPVLLDPVSPIMQDLAILHDEGQSISELLSTDGDTSKADLRVDNDALSRKGPQGVRVVAANWR